MQRYNAFNMIHKALRHMLYDTALTLQQTWFADIKEAETAIEKTEAVIHIFERHAHHEDTYVLPAVEKYNAALVASFEAEHKKDLGLGNLLKNLINIYRNVNFEEERINAGSALTKAFIDFMVFNLEHMGKEEILINKVLWEHYTDEQLLDISQQIAASIPPEELAFASKWMIRSINNKEAIGWLSQVKATAPPFVLQSILTEAVNTLPSERVEKIQEGIAA
ncbi:hypothetical protein FRZ67_08265 [Panacibacter ginsenosidivorans]|uniref:Hemerythrin-like domain-containing protein n=1 Tax=Panacibacter ginsenosidivorans TaxID=1813871 RepID=A0A5B8V744_9BACT|nr:hypothetical protein [Panacibacter ginsenosidivorans]QEC67287.1 hypothetical protein FRZ67_08265 [Panacibacter ginsenosidivorans]